MFKWIKFGDVALKMLKNALNLANIDDEMKNLLLKKAEEGYLPDPDSLLEEKPELYLFVAALHREIARFISAISLKSDSFIQEALGAYLLSLIMLLTFYARNKNKKIEEEIRRTLFEMNYIATSKGAEKERDFMENVRLIVEKALEYVEYLY